MQLSFDRRGVLFGTAGLVAAGRARAQEAVVETATGKVRGAFSQGETAFLGIPYAAPPIGPLRYRGPQRAAAWSGVRDATRPGAASIQTLGGAAAWLYESAEPQSEDCLFLNVWTPSLGGRKPVMVWLHGGAWRTGHGAVAGTIGSRLATRGDVVVVSINYRLNALGWLAHPDLRDEATGAYGNWGHQDQIAALRWVRDNIAAFGGDPGRVTIFGQSAGGESVAALAQNPANAGLFHAAILQSASLHGAPGFPEPATAAAYAEELAKRLGTSVKGLRDVPAQTIHDTEVKLGRDPALMRVMGRAPVLPVLDDIVLKAWPRDGGFPAVPLLVGTNRDEGVFFYDLISPDGTLVAGPKPPQDAAELEKMIAGLGDIYRTDVMRPPPAEVAAVYRASAAQGGEPNDPKRLWLSVYTDVVFRARAVAAARRHAAAGRPAYLYEFEHPLLAPAYGVPHTAEIPFIFATYDDPFFARKVGAGEAERALSAMMLETWAHFAHHGEPASAQTGAWRRVGTDGQGINVLGGSEALHRPQSQVRPEQLAVWGL